ncbi:unnamed protein product [Oikopleura dioica]|uniref:4Fe-4S ferredoxin-type domain-containing protein n=1 Tax=Oikopleura dioica TaxID=34765 RepID=E4XH93_OIKDI|nr:unnamed protein product [Oikopleura dioica]
MSEKSKPEKPILKRKNIFEKRNDDINYAIITESNKWLVSAHKCMFCCRCEKRRCKVNCHKMVEEIQHAKNYCKLEIDSCERCTRFAGFVAYHTKYLCEEGKNCQVTWCQRVREIQKRYNNRFKPKRMKMIFEFPEASEAVELKDSQEIKDETTDVKTENSNDDLVKQEPIDDIDFNHQVPLLDGEVKTEPSEEAEGAVKRQRDDCLNNCHNRTNLPTCIRKTEGKRE